MATISDSFFFRKKGLSLYGNLNLNLNEPVQVKIRECKKPFIFVRLSLPSICKTQNRSSMYSIVSKDVKYYGA
jgi:hypothetical protein